ncbi:MAG: SOS response-associated peptidase [Alphaproteobacteria bacterium]
MCGRKYNLPTLDWETYRSLFDLGMSSPQSNFAPNYNIAPTHEVPVVANINGERVIHSMRWGLLPFWAKDKKVGYKMINARAETVEEKRSFSPSLKDRRCIIPVSGFYEWKRESKTEKHAYAIRRKDERPLLLAGLWACNKQIEKDTELETYTVLTHSPNTLVADIHNRMPVIVDEDEIGLWLDAPWGEAKGVTETAFSAERMEAFAVSNDVGKVSNNSPELVTPLH